MLSIENLGITEGEAADILALFTQPDEAGPALTLGNTSSISTPYPGTRTSMQGDGYSADIAILKTPVGFFLISLEQERVDPVNQQAYEDLLKSFALLDTPPFDANLNQLQPVTLGPLDLVVPEGDLRVESNTLLWKSTAAGILTAEVIKLGREQTLKGLLDAWESALLSAETGLATRTATLALHVEDRDALQADYSGDRMLARVQVSALDGNNALVLALIARKETFASHQPLLDAVSFSAVPAGKRPPRAPASVAPDPATETRAYNDIVMAVSERLGTDPQGINRLYKQKPTLFDTIRQTLADIRAVDTLLSGDPEQLVKSVGWKERTSSPEGLKDFQAALRSYRVSLGLLPQGTRGPELPGSLSRRYAAARRSGREAVAAYSDSLDQLDDFPGRETLYSALLKAKGQTGQAVAPEMERYLKGKADLYWRNRLEVGYQQALLREGRGVLVEAFWDRVSKDLEVISSSADR